MMAGMGDMGDMGDKMMNRFFRKVSNVKWDLFSGKIGVATSEGIVTLSGEGEDAQIELNLMDQFGMPVPAFAQSTPMASVTVGDLIFQGNNIKGWVTEVVRSANTTTPSTVDGETDTVVLGAVKRFKLMTPSGTTTTWTPPKVSTFGFDSGVMVLRSLMNMLPGGEAGLNNMQGMLMPMMMMGSDSGMDLEKMMPMMLFSQLGASGTGADAMGANNNMMQMMMMMNMMGGKSGSKNGPGFFES